MSIIDYGVARLSIIPVRGEASDSSEMVSQLLFGENYSVIEFDEEHKWAQVINAFDDYQGWIDLKQHHSISKEYFEQIQNSEYKICVDLVAPILFNKKSTYITSGAILPLLNNPIFTEEENVAFNGNAKSLHQKVGIATLIEYAKKYLNSPYLWGGRSPFGIDCSGFTQVVYRIAGYQLKRDSSEQISQGEAVSFGDHIAGDLVFFTNKNGKMNHVGIVVDKEKVIHASGKVRVDKLDENGIFNLEQNSYTHHFLKIKRIIK